MRQFQPMGGDPALERLRHALNRAHPAPAAPVAPGRRAAVAAVLRESDGGPLMLFIRRAEHPRDPWSGQMAWPGGRIDPDDESPLAAALREAREELALDLARDGELAGQLSEVRTHIRQGSGPLSVVPFVFFVRASPPLTPNAEVEEALWIPLSFFLDPGNRGRFVWSGRGVPLAMPCYRYDGRVIWGLTLRMLEEVLDLLRAGAPGDAR